MIEQEKSRVNRYNFEYRIKEVSGKSLRDMTGEDVANILFDYDDNTNFGWTIESYEHHTERKFIHRFNMLWVYPLVLISAPITYLFTGTFGVNRNSFIGKIVDKLVKFE